MDRRDLLKHLAALGLAVPAMSMERTYFFGPWIPDQPPKLWSDAIHDDAMALQWYLDHGKQIPKGLYRSGTLLKFPHVPHFAPDSMGGLQLISGPMLAADALIKYSPSAEFGQKSALAAEAMALIRSDFKWAEFAKAREAVRRLPNRDDGMAVGEWLQAWDKRVQQLVESLPPVDYSGLTPEQARESLYCTFLESVAASDAVRARLRAAAGLKRRSAP